MIRKLSSHDLPAAKQLLGENPAFNLYLLGNLESVGLAADFCEFWGDFAAGDNRMRAILNRYMSGWALYGRPAADWPGLAALVDQHPTVATRLQDNPGGLTSFLPFLTRYAAEAVHEEELMALDARDFAPAPPPAGVTVRRADRRDLADLIALYADAGDMQRSPAGVERPLRDNRIWLAEEGGRIVSAALTNAETAALAMVGGVHTPPAARNRGLSQAVCSALCADLLRGNKQPVLYWRAPAAGAIYRKLGFKAVGVWRSVWLRLAY